MIANVLAAHLVVSFVDLLPGQIAVRAFGPSLEVFDGGDFLFAVGVGNGFEDMDDMSIFGACIDVLNSIQDAVSESLTEPWPNETMPPPNVSLERDRIRLWYGEDDSSAFRLRDINLSV